MINAQICGETCVNNNNNNNNSIYLFRVKHYSVTKLFFKMALRTKTNRLNVINNHI